MARPKTDPTAPSAPKTPEEAIEQGLIDVSHIDADKSDNPTAAEAIVVANQALEEKRAALEKIGTARDFLHQFIELGLLSQSQAAWVYFFIPRKKKGEAADSDEE